MRYNSHVSGNVKSQRATVVSLPFACLCFVSPDCLASPDILLFSFSKFSNPHVCVFTGGAWEDLNITRNTFYIDVQVRKLSPESILYYFMRTTETLHCKKSSQWQRKPGRLRSTCMRKGVHHHL